MTHWERFQSSQCSCTRSNARNERFFVHENADDKEWLEQVGIGNSDSEQKARATLTIDDWAKTMMSLSLAQMMWIEGYAGQADHDERNHGCDLDGFGRPAEYFLTERDDNAISREQVPIECDNVTYKKLFPVYGKAASDEASSCRAVFPRSVRDSHRNEIWDIIKRTRFFKLKQEYFLTTCSVQRPRGE